MANNMTSLIGICNNPAPGDYELAYIAYRASFKGDEHDTVARLKIDEKALVMTAVDFTSNAHVMMKVMLDTDAGSSSEVLRTTMEGMFLTGALTIAQLIMREGGEPK